MNLWESWYQDYMASEIADRDMMENLTLWSSRFIEIFVLGGYAQNQSPFTLQTHEVLGLLSFLYRDGMDVEIVLDLAEDFTQDRGIQIPVQWLAEPQEMARMHTAWAHDIFHDRENEGFWLTPRTDLESMAPNDRICMLLDTAEFILELGSFLGESERIRIDTWAKLLYGEKMLQASSTLLIGQAAAALSRAQRNDSYFRDPPSLELALVSYCRADKLDESNAIIQGPPIDERQAESLAGMLALSSTDEEELAQTVEHLCLDSGESRISSTYLSDSQQWLEGFLHAAQMILIGESSESQISDVSLEKLATYLEQASSLARVNGILSVEQRAQVRRWALDIFNS